MWYVVGLLLIFGVNLVNPEHHSLQYFYTGTTGMADFPSFVAVGILDGKQIDYYDSVIGKNVLRQAWMEGTRDENRITDVRRGYQATFSANVNILMERFNQTLGVHTVQEMYGCEWDDQTGAKDAFEQHGYDGEEYLSLDLKETRWISPVPQGIITQNKWNNDRGLLENYKNYFNTECIEWLQKYLQYGKSNLQKTVSPQVSLLQKDSSSPVTCHVTGFYPSGVTITWMKNGQEHHEDVDLGELLPNEDGTFQKTSSLKVTPDELKKNQYRCVVEHQGKSVTEDEIRKNEGDSFPFAIIIGVLAAAVLLIGIAVAGYVVYKKKKVPKSFNPVNGSDDGSNSSANAVPHA